MTTTTTTTTTAPGPSVTVAACDQSDITCDQPTGATIGSDTIPPDTAPGNTGGGGGIGEQFTDALTNPGGPAAVAGEVATDVAADAAGTAAGAVLSGPLGVLNQAAEEMAGTAFGDLSATLAEQQTAQTIQLGPFSSTLHVAAGFVAFAAVATTLLIALVMPHRRFGERVLWAGGALVRFALISAFGVTIAVTAVDASNQLAGDALVYALPDGEIDTSGANIYTGALAGIVVPVVGVLFDFQRWLMAVFIMFWPLAAAISITRSFRHALPIMTAMIAANVVWPPLAGLAVGKSLAALPDISAATWWAVGAVAVAFITNLFALAARSTQ